MQLYTVRYALQHMVSKFDAKGKKISDEVRLIEQTLTALPHATAMQYSKMPNFSIEPYQMERGERSSFKFAAHDRGEVGVRQSKSSKPKTVFKKSSGVHHAAATGDLGAAISGGE